MNKPRIQREYSVWSAEKTTEFFAPEDPDLASRREEILRKLLGISADDSVIFVSDANDKQNRNIFNVVVDDFSGAAFPRHVTLDIDRNALGESAIVHITRYL